MFFEIKTEISEQSFLDSLNVNSVLSAYTLTTLPDNKFMVLNKGKITYIFSIENEKIVKIKNFNLRQEEVLYSTDPINTLLRFEIIHEKIDTSTKNVILRVKEDFDIKTDINTLAYVLKLKNRMFLFQQKPFLKFKKNNDLDLFWKFSSYKEAVSRTFFFTEDQILKKKYLKKMYSV